MAIAPVTGVEVLEILLGHSLLPGMVATVDSADATVCGRQVSSTRRSRPEPGVSWATVVFLRKVPVYRAVMRRVGGSASTRGGPDHPSVHSAPHLDKG